MSNRNIAYIAALGASALWLGCDAGAPVATTSGNTELWLASADSTDVQGGVLVTDADLAHALNFERAPISLSWDPGQAVDTPSAPHVAQSRHYRTRVSGQELASGVELSLTAPHALIQVAMRPDAALASLADDDISMVAADGRAYSGHQAMEAIVSAEDMQDSELPFARGTTFLRMRPDIEPGAYSLRVRGLESESDVVITVLEPESAVTLALSNSANSYLQGQTLQVDARWATTQGIAPLAQSLRGTLRSPTGERTAVTFVSAGPEAFHGELVLDAGNARPGELWEVEIEATAQDDRGLTVRRSVTTAFAYAETTATLTGRVSVVTDADRADTDKAVGNPSMAFAVNVGSSGRYALTGVLFGTDDQGAMRPVAIAQSAAFFEPGARDIALTFDRGLIENSGMSAPYEVRELRLLDQTRMGVLHRQARALAVPTL